LFFSTLLCGRPAGERRGQCASEFRARAQAPKDARRQFTAFAAGVQDIVETAGQCRPPVVQRDLSVHERNQQSTTEVRPRPEARRQHRRLRDVTHAYDNDVIAEHRAVISWPRSAFMDEESCVPKVRRMGRRLPFRADKQDGTLFHGSRSEASTCPRWGPCAGDIDRTGNGEQETPSPSLQHTRAGRQHHGRLTPARVAMRMPSSAVSSRQERNCLCSGSVRGRTTSWRGPLTSRRSFTKVRTILSSW